MYNPIQKVRNMTPNVEKHIKNCEFEVLLEPNIVSFGTLENLLSEFRNIIFHFRMVGFGLSLKRFGL